MSKTKSFAERIRSKRGKRTQLEAAAALKVSPKTYVNWEQGRNIPDTFKQAALLKAL